MFVYPLIMNSKILIIEDEIVVAEDLSTILRTAGYTVVGHAARGVEALELIRSTDPDLVLLDIKLRGKMTGLDVAHSINGQIPYLFITSLKDVKLRDEIATLDAGGYLLKPFVEEELLVNVKLALARSHSREIIAPKPTGLLIRNGSVLEKVNSSEIAYAKGEDNYTKVRFINGKEHLLSHTLKSVEQKLSGFSSFCRVHKSYVVNLDHLMGIEGQNLIFQDQIIPIGKSYRSSLFQKFDFL